MSQPHPYLGARFRLATHHHKGAIIAPVFRDVLDGVVEEVDCDTDALGTFDGEIPRRGSPYDTALAKAALIDPDGARGVLASEGSFSPHPQSPLITVNTELVILRDCVSTRVFVGSAFSTTPHILRRDVGEDDRDLTTWVARADLASHAVVVQAVNDDMTVVAKGVQSPEELTSAIDAARSLSPTGVARVTSDGRAHLNASRRDVIALAARDLADRLLRRCPSCHEPGWGTTGSVSGAPCRDCGSPTAQPWGQRWACPACGHDEDQIDQEQRADPARCSWCNP